jgi:hypothetical protein
MKRKDFLATAAGLAATIAATGAAFGQTQMTPPVHPTKPRGEIGSARNIRNVRAMLEKLIDQLQRDQHDFGGYRVRALEDMRRARQSLDQALQWDATHGH